MADFRVHHVRFFEFQPKAIHCIAYQSDTERVAVSRSDGTIEIWSINDNWLQEKVIVGDASRSVEAVVWCGRRLFSAGLSGEVVEYDLNKLQPIASVHSNAGPIWCLTKNSANTKLAAGTEAGCVVLFDVSGDLLNYERAFDKQEGRILSLSWHVGEEVLVTGGVDNIRVWSVGSGHAIQRLTLRRTDNNKETIVWCVAITGDMTIVSGDSRGKTSFWNGKQGTLIKSFQSHKADVLCLAVSETEDSIFCSGVDPTLVKFEYTPTMPNSDWKNWVRSSARNQHSHDVQALAHTRQHIVSGGVDTNLILNRLEKKQDFTMSQKIPAIPQLSMVCVATEAELLALNYGTYLEVWRLGSSGAKSEKHGDILPLRDNPVKLLQLKTKNSETVVCFSISRDGKWLCYSDQENLRLYRLHLANKVTPIISVERIKLTSPLNSPAHRVVFTPDSAKCVVAVCDGTVQVISLNSAFPSMQHSIPPLDQMSECSVGLLATSPNSKLAAIYYHGNTIAIFDIENKQHLCKLPQYSYQSTAMAFSPSSEDLVIAYADQKVLEFSVTQQEYSTWCRQNMKKFHRHWLKRNAKISGISFNPRAPHQIVLHDIQMLCVLDKTQPFPGPDINLHNKPTWNQEPDSTISTDHAFHICNKYKYLLHTETLTDDWLLVVERPPSSIMDALPQTLKQKKFGT